MNFILPDKDGNPQFIGKEDPNNPPVKPREGSKMECPQCKNMVDYLLGYTKKGCEVCYKKQEDKIDNSSLDYNKEEEIL